MELIVVFAVTMISASLQATIGFGFSILVMLLLPNLMPYPEAVTLNIAIALMNTSYLTVKNRKHIVWKTLLPLLLPSLIIGIFFTFYSSGIDAQYMDIILGSLLIGLSLYFISFSDRIKVEPKPSRGILMGSIAGIGNGFFGIGGPPAALYLMPAVEDKREYLATIQCYFALCNLVNLITRAFMGYFKAELISFTLSGWAGALIGSVLGGMLFKRINLKVLRKAVYFFVGINGFYLILSTILK